MQVRVIYIFLVIRNVGKIKINIDWPPRQERKGEAIYNFILYLDHGGSCLTVSDYLNQDNNFKLFINFYYKIINLCFSIFLHSGTYPCINCEKSWK